MRRVDNRWHGQSVVAGPPPGYSLYGIVILCQRVMVISSSVRWVYPCAEELSPTGQPEFLILSVIHRNAHPAGNFHSGV